MAYLPRPTLTVSHHQTMLGMTVEFPVDHGEYRIGTIEECNDESGAIKVRDDEGDLWSGYAYQVTTA